MSHASRSTALTSLVEGMPIVFGGDRVTTVSAALAEAFTGGDRLVVVQESGDLLHIPSADAALVDVAVADAATAFAELGSCTDAQISTFYDVFAARLEDTATFTAILAANDADVDDAKARGRSTTRLVLSTSMRSSMVDGLRAWRDALPSRDTLLECVEHDGWTVEQRRAPLGVVGFVFEGRPNVFADATGVLRSGNTVVFRIGRDALRTARAIVAHAVDPALAQAGLPSGAVRLLDAPSRATGWALFSHVGLGLAVARGSGEAVAQLGAVARQAGVPVSLHGTGGAWLVAGEHADPSGFAAAVFHSLDRKVCNTLNVCCIPLAQADALVPRFLDALTRAAERRGAPAKLHVLAGSETHVPNAWFAARVGIARAAGIVTEPKAEVLDEVALGTEWEWEDSPEVTLAIVRDVAHGVDLANRYSPRLVASLVSSDATEHDRFWTAIDVPFVGNGFTRWVDGQFALGKPELGLSNWERGRLFARSAVLSGDSVFTVRTRVVQSDPDIHR
jgi:glutamate-5-semialdehyde dehydrogenase